MNKSRIQAEQSRDQAWKGLEDYTEQIKAIAENELAPAILRLVFCVVYGELSYRAGLREEGDVAE